MKFYAAYITKPLQIFLTQMSGKPHNSSIVKNRLTFRLDIGIEGWLDNGIVGFEPEESES